jgi:hypothetical protein
MGQKCKKKTATEKSVLKKRTTCVVTVVIIRRVCVFFRSPSPHTPANLAKGTDEKTRPKVEVKNRKPLINSKPVLYN